jgi:hypothetical protein
MIAKREQYRVRGYPNPSLTASLGLQRQTFKRKKEEYSSIRMKFLQPKNTQGSPDRVIALKLPYTCNTNVLEKHLKISKLQKYIENHCPALCRASVGRFVIANLRTKNIRDSAKYQLPKPSED